VFLGEPGLPDYFEKPLSQLHDELLSSIAEVDARYEAELKPLRTRLQKVKEAQRLLAEAYEAAEATNRPPSRPPGDDFFSDQPRPVQTRLRIGDQRYRMLQTVRASGSITDSEVAAKTGYGIRRVKEQLQADVRIGVLTDTEGRYSLTQSGASLMDQFEKSRLEKGKSLPTVVGWQPDEHHPNDGGTNG
jgi:hypothetical protein